MKQLQEQVRKFPKGKEFTYLKKVDRLYAYLTVYSTYDYQNGGYNCTLKKDVPISTISKDLGKGRTAIYNQIKKLRDGGFLEETGDRYILKVDTPFLLVPKGLLIKMYNIFTDEVINTYIYLVGQYEYFVTTQGREHFTFSQTQLITEVYGLTPQTKNHAKARNILDILYITGLIEIADYKEEINGGYYYVMTGYGTEVLGGLDELRKKGRKLPDARKFNFG